MLLFGLAALGFSALGPLATTALAAPRPIDPVEARLSAPLRHAARAGDAGDVAALDAFRHRTPRPLDPDGLSVTVEPAPGEAPDALVARLLAAGLRVEAAAGGLVQARVPWTRLRDVAALDGVARVREPWRPTPKEAKVTEGWDATMAQDWHAQGVNGAGATIGILDVGFQGLDTLAAEELPADLLVDYDRGDPTLTEHGTAVTEIVNDFAPGASYYVATFGTETEFCEVLQVMVDAGVDVVNGSIGFDNVWHTDGTSPVTICADQVVADGALYFAAAGNENDKYRVGGLAYDTDPANAGLVQLEGVPYVRAYTAGGYAAVSFRWSEPMGGAAEDMDLYVYNDDQSLCGSSLEYQDGQGYPYEAVFAEGCSDRVDVYLFSEGKVASLEGLEGYLYSYYGLEEAYWTGTEDLTLPGDTVDGVSVGAYYPELDEVAYYSSRGPTNDGRTKPDLVAPTGVTTSTYGRKAFEGSSAATPHATGLGALWVSATGYHGAPGQLKGWMKNNARDLGEPGADNESGAGAIRGDALPEGVCACGTGSPVGGALGVVAGALALLRRRRR